MFSLWVYFKLCKACILLEGLNRGLPKLGIGKMTAGNLAAHIRKLEAQREMSASRVSQ